MRFLTVVICGMLVATATASQAQDRQNNIGEDAPWRFRSASDRVATQNSLSLFELNKAGYFDQIQSGNMAALAGAGGLLGSSAGNTNNVFNFVDQSTTTNNCSATAVGSTITCGRGDNTVTDITQTSTGNTNTAETTITGNTLTNQGNQTNVNTGNGNQNNGSPTGGE